MELDSWGRGVLVFVAMAEYWFDQLCRTRISFCLRRIVPEQQQKSQQFLECAEYEKAACNWWRGSNQSILRLKRRASQDGCDATTRRQCGMSRRLKQWQLQSAWKHKMEVRKRRISGIERERKGKKRKSESLSGRGNFSASAVPLSAL